MKRTVEVGDGAKYTFVYDSAQVDILRYGEPWVTDLPGQNAVMALMDRVLELEKLCARIPELEAEGDKIHADRVRLADKLAEIKAVVLRPKP